MEMRKTEAIAEAALKKQEASPDLLSNRTGSSHSFSSSGTSRYGNRQPEALNCSKSVEPEFGVSKIFRKAFFSSVVSANFSSTSP